MLVGNLPEQSALRRSVLGATWTTTDELLASVYDAVQSGNWQRQQNKHAPRPKRFPRPGPDPGRKTYGSAMSVDEMRVVLDNWGSTAN